MLMQERQHCPEALLYKATSGKPDVWTIKCILDTNEMGETVESQFFSKQAVFSYGCEFTLTYTGTCVDFSAEMERTLQVLDMLC